MLNYHNIILHWFTEVLKKLCHFTNISFIYIYMISVYQIIFYNMVSKLNKLQANGDSIAKNIAIINLIGVSHIVPQKH